MKKFISALLVAFTIFTAIPLETQAASVDTAAVQEMEYNDGPDVIIGKSEISATPGLARVPNLLTVNWVASETQVIISVFNTGIDTVDTFAGTVKTGSTSKAFTATKLAPLTTKTITVNINMLKCYEDITVDYYGIDGKTEFGKGRSTGHREMPANLSSSWHQGSFSSVYDSINYHFNKHKSGVGSSNICAYVRSAQGFKSNLSGATSSPVYGPTPNVTRYKKNGKFIDIYGTPNAGKIISYGKS